MYKIGSFLVLVLMAYPAEAQIIVTGERSVAKPAPVRIATDRGANIRSPRRERNRFFAARPVYPPVERGSAARINFEPFTNKYYPRASEYGSTRTTSPLIRGR